MDVGEPSTDVTTPWRRMPHPLLFAVAPILLLFSNNLGFVDARSLVLPIAVSLLIAAVAALGLDRAGVGRAKAALLTTVAVVGFYFYGHIQEGLVTSGGIRLFFGSTLAVLLLWTAAFSGLALLVARVRRDLGDVTRLINGFGTILVAVAVVPIFLAAGGPSVAPGLPAAEATAADRPHNVYHIVLDGYAGAGVLADPFGYDNTPFIEALEAQGFYVAADARSNYVQTVLSLPSTLNMQYLDTLFEVDSEHGGDRTQLWQVGRDSKVLATFDQLGYETIHVGSSFWGFTASNEHADLALSCGFMDEFGFVLFRTTLLRAFEDQILLEEVRQRTKCGFDRLREAAARPGPTYVFAHFIAPHPPFVFQADGTATRGADLDVGGQWDASAYVAQLEFINAKVLQVVDDILATDPSDPIMIIHGDHGTLRDPSDSRYLYHDDEMAGLGQPWPEDFRRLVRERTSVLNAVRLPGQPGVEPYPSLSPVNDFRLVFDGYYGTDLGILEDRTFFSSYNRPYAFVDVTDQPIA